MPLRPEPDLSWVDTRSYSDQHVVKIGDAELLIGKLSTAISARPPPLLLRLHCIDITIEQDSEASLTKFDDLDRHIRLYHVGMAIRG
jgi:hypothetical protein